MGRCDEQLRERPLDVDGHASAPIASWTGQGALYRFMLTAACHEVEGEPVGGRLRERMPREGLPRLAGKGSGAPEARRDSVSMAAGIPALAASINAVILAWTIVTYFLRVLAGRDAAGSRVKEDVHQPQG